MIKIRAKIYLYKHKGRGSSIKDGYRPGFSFTDNNNEVFTGHIELIDSSEFETGTLGEVFISFTQNDLVEKFITVGNTFSLNEPPIEVGEGEILEILKN